MPVVIADASPLVALSLIDRLEWLPKLFGVVQVVPSVLQEVLTERFSKSENNIRFAIKQGWLQPVNTAIPSMDRLMPTQKTHWEHLDAGEAQSIAYALTQSSLVPAQQTALLIDERAGRQVCTELDIPVIGTAGIVQLAKQYQLIGLVKPELERLHDAGFWLSALVVKAALLRAGEF